MERSLFLLPPPPPLATPTTDEEGEKRRRRPVFPPLSSTAAAALPPARKKNGFGTGREEREEQGSEFASSPSSPSPTDARGPTPTPLLPLPPVANACPPGLRVENGSLPSHKSSQLPPFEETLNAAIPHHAPTPTFPPRPTQRKKKSAQKSSSEIDATSKKQERSLLLKHFSRVSSTHSNWWHSERRNWEKYVFFLKQKLRLSP